MCWGFPRRRPKFLSTPSARRATISGAEHRAHGTDFYPRLREEGDPIPTPRRGESNQFLSTPPRGGRPRRPSKHRSQCRFLSTPPRGGRRIAMSDLNLRIAISIHALREEATQAQRFLVADLRFLSTPSARRATRQRVCGMLNQRNFYPRPPRGGRHYVFEYAIPLYPFLSTPSARRRPTISSASSAPRNFYPRPPRGGDPDYRLQDNDYSKFLSTPPRGGRLCPAWLRFCGCCYFYPRPPRGGRHQCAMSYITTFNISIHALREEGDWMISLSRAIPSISIHALREEGD